MSVADFSSLKTVKMIHGSSIYQLLLLVLVDFLLFPKSRQENSGCWKPKVEESRLKCLQVALNAQLGEALSDPEELLYCIYIFLLSFSTLK